MPIWTIGVINYDKFVEQTLEFKKIIKPTREDILMGIEEIVIKLIIHLPYVTLNVRFLCFLLTFLGFCTT